MTGRPSMTGMGTDADVAALVREGIRVDVEAHWGAGFLDGRYDSPQPTWNWPDIAASVVAGTQSVLDMGTGDGGALLEVPSLPGVDRRSGRCVAYEEWWPTVDAARRTLRPRGAHLVVALGSDDNPIRLRTRPGLPFGDGVFDVVLNRHEAFDAHELHRVLRAGGLFLTQQVAGDEALAIRRLLGLPAPEQAWHLAAAHAELDAGFVVIDAHQEHPVSRFTDVAALVAYVRSTPWDYTDVLDRPDVWEPDGPLWAALTDVHARCQADGAVATNTGRFWLLARRR